MPIVDPSIYCETPPGIEPKRIMADFFMPVGTTGIVFVTSLPAVQYPNFSVVFNDKHTRNALWHASADIADMGLIDGQTFAFIRNAIPMTTGDTATLLGVSEATVLDWEAKIQPVPREMWISLANEARVLAQEGGSAYLALVNPPDLRPRTIRIVTPFSGRSI